MGIGAELLDLVLPTVCVACGRPGGVWCAACRPAPTLRWVGSGPAAHPAPDGRAALIFAAGDYAGPMRTALIGYKERGLHRLAEPLAGYLRWAVEALVEPDRSTAGIALVPVPSRRAAARERGGDHVLRLAKTAAEQPGAGVLQLLRLGRGARDSAGLNSDERAANLAGRMCAVPGGPAAAARPVVVVDDIVTTGATAREAVRALSAAGHRVVGVACVAATERRRPARARPGVRSATPGCGGPTV